MRTKRFLPAAVLLVGLSLSSAYALADAGADAGMSDAAAAPIAATAAPATGSAAPDALGTPDMTTEEAIEAVKLAIGLLKEGSYPAGLSLLWLVLAWGFGRWIYPMVKGKMSSLVVTLLGAGMSFVTVLATGLASGLSIWLALATALTDSLLVGAILDAMQRKNADSPAAG